MSDTGPEHERFRDSAAAYVLRALPEPEEVEFEHHLAACAACRGEVDDLRVATDALALAVPAMTPPPDLKARLMGVVEQEAELLRAAGPEADRPPAAAPAARRRRRSTGWLLRPALAVPAALVVLALGGLLGALAAGALEEEAGGMRMVRAQVDPASAPGARVFLHVGAGGVATLVAERMPAPPRGRVYQVWVKRPGADPEPTSTLFVPRSDGSASASVPESLEGVEAVLVSHEPRGGSPSPTSAPVLTVAPPA